MAALFMVLIKYMQITLRCLTVSLENTYLKHISGPSFFFFNLIFSYGTNQRGWGISWIHVILLNFEHFGVWCLVFPEWSLYRGHLGVPGHKCQHESKNVVHTSWPNCFKVRSQYISKNTWHQIELLLCSLYAYPFFFFLKNPNIIVWHQVKKSKN